MIEHSSQTHSSDLKVTLRVHITINDLEYGQTFPQGTETARTGGQIRERPGGRHWTQTEKHQVLTGRVMK